MKAFLGFSSVFVLILAGKALSHPPETISCPAGPYVHEGDIDGKHLVLTGKATSVHLKGKLDGHSTFDLRGLTDLNEVTIDGKTAGESKLLLPKCKGPIVIGRIDGKTTVLAPGCTDFTVKEKIDGHAAVTVEACTNFTVNEKIDGKSTVTVKGTGHFKCGKISANSTVTWNGVAQK
jgi:hypothetical protein